MPHYKAVRITSKYEESDRVIEKVVCGPGNFFSFPPEVKRVTVGIRSTSEKSFDSREDILSERYHKPFPQWMTKSDPFTADWEENGIFVAFEERRQRREGWLGQKLPTLYPRLQSPLTFMAPFLALYFSFLVWLNFPIFGIILTGSYAILWIYLAFPLPNSDRLPFTVNTLFFPCLQRKKLDTLRVVPDKEGGLSEALMLDTLLYYWEIILILYWLVIAGGLNLLFWYLRFKYSIPGSQAGKYLVVLSSILCGYMMMSFFLTKANEVLANRIIKDLRAYELEGPLHAVLHFASEIIAPVIYIPFYYILFAFELFTFLGLILLLLEWGVELVVPDISNQLFILQGVFSIVLLTPCLFARKLAVYSMEKGKEKVVKIRLRIKHQLDRIL